MAKEETKAFLSYYDNYDSRVAESVEMKTNDRYEKIKEERDARIREERDSRKRSYLKYRYKQKLHQLFVDECLAPKGYLDGRPEVFAFISSIEGENVIQNEQVIDYYHIRISLMTPKMAYTDYVYFNEKDSLWWNEEYLPYYYSFSCTIPANNTCWNENLKAHYEENEWFCLNIQRENTPSSIKGILTFEGSEQFSDTVYIETSGVKPPTLISNIYPGSGNPSLSFEDYISNNLLTSGQYNVRVLNVGQANCIHIATDTFSFLFDVGGPNAEVQGRSNSDLVNGTGIRRSFNILSGYRPDLVIVSHYHEDHYRAYTKLESNGINCDWVFPHTQNSKNDSNIQRIASSASANNRSVYWITQDNLVYDNNVSDNRFQIWRGVQGDLNSHSLILRIRDTIFAADSLYQYWPDGLKQKSVLTSIQKLIAPHHGCSLQVGIFIPGLDFANLNQYHSINSNNNKTVVSMFGAVNKKAIICYGDNSYGHPGIDHITALKTQGFTVFETGGTRNAGNPNVGALDFNI